MFMPQFYAAAFLHLYFLRYLSLQWLIKNTNSLALFRVFKLQDVQRFLFLFDNTIVIVFRSISTSIGLEICACISASIAASASSLNALAVMAIIGISARSLFSSARIFGVKELFPFLHHKLQSF